MASSVIGVEYRREGDREQGEKSKGQHSIFSFFLILCDSVQSQEV